MLRLIPPPLHRFLYRAADRVRRRWWRIAKPQRRSVLIVAFDEEGRVVLVRHSYGRPVWALPGGGMGRREDPAATAAREFREELGCDLADLRVLPPLARIVAGSREVQSLCVGRLVGVPRPDMREVVAAELFAPTNLPADCASYVPRRLERALEAVAARS
jgi:8-oxo-dGTP pyrophosphatase MutT (NUDIX family)